MVGWKTQAESSEQAKIQSSRSGRERYLKDLFFVPMSQLGGVETRDETDKENIRMWLLVDTFVIKFCCPN